MVSIRDSNVFLAEVGLRFASPNEGLAGLETACALENLGEISGRLGEGIRVGPNLAYRYF